MTQKMETREWIERAKRIDSKNLHNAESATVSPSLGMLSTDYKNLDSSTSQSEEGEQWPITTGLQTILNLARSKAAYNDDGQLTDKNCFLQMIQYLDELSMIQVTNKSSQTLTNESSNSNVLIKSFVSTFNGVSNGDITKMEASVSELVSIATSYANHTESESCLTQSQLITNEDGTVSCWFYYSDFAIEKTDSACSSTLVDSYILDQLEIILSEEDWNANWNLFQKMEQISTEQWLNSMQTNSN